MANPKNDEFNVKLLEEILIEHFKDKIKFTNDDGKNIDASVVFSEYGLMPIILMEAEDFCITYFNMPFTYYDWYENPQNAEDMARKKENLNIKTIFGNIAKIITRLNSFQIYIILLIAELILNIDENFNEKDEIKVINLDEIVRYYADEPSSYDGGSKIFTLIQF